MTTAPRAGRLASLARAALFIPVFSLWLAAVKTYAAVRGPLRVDGAIDGGVRVRCDLPDLVQMYIYLFGVWEPDLTAFVRRRLGPGDTFIDVGANVGYFAFVAAERVGEGGGVVAIEASPSIHERLAAAIEENGLRSRVRVALCAAAAERGSLTVYAGPAHNVGLTTTVASRGLQREARVEAAPLHEILEPGEISNARLVKIDVEGGEPAVLAGMGPFLDRARDDVEILVELSPLWWADAKRPPEEVLAPLRDRGFNAYAIDNNYWPWRYLWPAAVRRPRRVRELLTKRVKRYDLVLSRIDADEL